jgi:hypothetical protein
VLVGLEGSPERTFPKGPDGGDSNCLSPYTPPGYLLEVFAEITSGVVNYTGHVGQITRFI